MTVWHVTALSEDIRKGTLEGPLISVCCALGRSGIIPAANKCEGDGASPAGVYPFRRVFYRPDRIEVPITLLNAQPLSADLGWCDDPEDSYYNKLIRLPYGPSHEKLWRDDHVYDVIVELGHNDAPIVPGLGSAIFMHIAREGYTPTEGCVALSLPDMLRFLRLVKLDDQIKIG